MAYDIGPKIGIEGEAEFRKELGQINQNIKTLGSEMKAVTSSFADGANSEEAMAAKTDVLNRQIEEQRKKLDKLNDGLSAAVEKFGESDTRTQKWRQAVYEATAELNKMEHGLSETDDELDDVSDGMKDAEKKTISFSDVLKANLLGDAIKSGLKAIANGVKEIAGAMKDAVVDSAAYADEILTLSTNTGLSTDTLQELSYMAELTDTSLDTITGSMSKLIKNMNTASKGTGDAADAFSALGISIMDSNGEMRDNQDVFYEVVAALSEIENETQRDAYAMSIFGRSAQDLNSFMAQGADGIAALAQEAHDLGYVMDGDALSALGSVDDAMKRFDNSTSALKNNLVAGFAPAISTAIESLNGFISGQTSAAEFAATMSDLIMQGAKAILDGLPTLMETVKTIIGELFNGIRESFPEIAAVAIEIIGALVGGLMDGLPDILQGGFDMLMELVNGIISAIPDMIAALPEIITSIVTFIADNLDDVVGTGIKLIGALIEGLIKAIPTLIMNIPKIIVAIVEGLAKAVKQVVEVGKNIVKGVWEGIQAMASWIKDKVSGFFSGIVNGIKSLLGIKSPSKVFAGIGGYMAEGLGVGFDKEIGAVQKDINKSMSDLVPSASGSISISGNGEFGAPAYGFSATDIRSALSGIGIYMSGQRVGELTTISQRNNARAMGTA